MQQQVPCHKCQGTGRGVMADFFHNDGRPTACSGCHGRRFVYMDSVDIPLAHIIPTTTGNSTSISSVANTSRQLKRGMSYSIYVQVKGNCWAYATSKIIGFWESLLSTDGKRTTSTDDAIKILEENAKLLGNLSARRGGIPTGDFGALLGALSISGVTWKGKHLNEEDLKNY